MMNKLKQTKIWGLLALALMGSCAQHEEVQVESVSSKSLEVQGLKVPFAGNAFVTSAEDGATAVITTKGLVNWSSSQTVVSVYFRVNEPVNLDLSFTATNGSNAQSQVVMRYKDQEFLIDVNSDRYQQYHIGQINVEEPGYVKLDFSGVSKTGLFFGEISDLVIGGGVARDQFLFCDDPSGFHWQRRGPSVHLWYKTNHKKNLQYFYNEVTVAEGDDNEGSYFMTNGFNGGYAGIQVNSSTTRTVLFSIWASKANNPKSVPVEDRIVLLRKGDDVVVGEFGGEGSGGQSKFFFPWKAGTTYKILTKVEPVEGNATVYTSWFYAPELGYWKLLASFRKPHVSAHLKGIYSFLENFRPNEGYVNRRGFYDNQWVVDVEGEWVPISRASFSANSLRYRNDVKGGIGANGQFFMEIGGFFNDFVLPGKTYERTTSSVKPVIDLEQLP